MIPLIIITADRPKKLMNTGENQTINQQNIFNDYVRKFEDIGLPNEKNKLLNNKILSLFKSAIGTYEDPPGPVHINIPFEEPLIKNISDSKYEEVNVIFSRAAPPPCLLVFDI